MMQKSAYISISETGKINRKVNNIGMNVSEVNLNISRSNAQSRPSGILFASANSKLYFEVPGINSVPQNNLPRTGGGKRSKVAFPSKNSHH
jgi:hypothetical protein